MILLGSIWNEREVSIWYLIEGFWILARFFRRVKLMFLLVLEVFLICLMVIRYYGY